MIILRKKLILIISIFLIIILSFVTALSVVSSSGGEIPAYPINVVIDAGHGGIDHGTAGCSKKVYESDINLAIAYKLKSYFEKANIGVIMTRKDKNGLYGSSIAGFKKRDMLKRKEIITSSGADLVISIHLNKYVLPSRRGAQVFFRQDCPLGTLAAKKIQEKFNKSINTERELSALKGDYYILNCSEIPSVIAECGFLSCPEEEELLIDEQYQDKIAYNIFAGCIAYFGEISMLDRQLTLYKGE